MTRNSHDHVAYSTPNKVVVASRGEGGCSLDMVEAITIIKLRKNTSKTIKAGTKKFILGKSAK